MATKFRSKTTKVANKKTRRSIEDIIKPRYKISEDDYREAVETYHEIMEETGEVIKKLQSGKLKPWDKYVNEVILDWLDKLELSHLYDTNVMYMKYNLANIRKAIKYIDNEAFWRKLRSRIQSILENKYDKKLAKLLAEKITNFTKLHYDYLKQWINVSEAEWNNKNLWEFHYRIIKSLYRYALEDDRALYDEIIERFSLTKEREIMWREFLYYFTYALTYPLMLAIALDGKGLKKTDYQESLIHLLEDVIKDYILQNKLTIGELIDILTSASEWIKNYIKQNKYHS